MLCSWSEGETIQTSTLKYDNSYRLLDVLYQFEEISFYSLFDENFYQELLLNFVKCLFCINSYNYMDFLLCTINMVVHIDWFSSITTSALNFKFKIHLLMLHYSSYLLTDLLICWWGFFCSGLWEANFGKPLSQCLPSGSFHKPFILLHQRADRLKTSNGPKF